MEAVTYEEMSTMMLTTLLILTLYTILQTTILVCCIIEVNLDYLRKIDLRGVENTAVSERCFVLSNEVVASVKELDKKIDSLSLSHVRGPSNAGVLGAFVAKTE